MDTATDTRPPVRRYADPFTCPACAHRLPLQLERCPDCGLLLQSLLARQLLTTLRIADNQLAQLVAASHRQPTPPQTPTAVLPPLLPAPSSPERRGLSEVTVPKLLLGIGALCLLVAAIIFLALTWSWLGIGGRTAVLAGLTVVTGGLGVVLTRRDLRVAGESLTTVALGLLTLDVLGAVSAGWLGQLDHAGLLLVLGGVLLTAALPLALTTRLVAPQVVAAGAWSLVGMGLLDASRHAATAVAVVVLGYAVLAGVAGVRRITPLVVGAAAGAACWWSGLVALGLQEAAAHLSVRGMWVEGHGAPLLLASLMLLLPAWSARRHSDTSRAFAAAAATALTIIAMLPAADESVTTMGVVALVALVGWTLVALVTPAAWRPVSLAPTALCAVPVLLLTLGLGAQAVANAVTGYTQQPEAAPALLLLGTAALLAAATTVLPRASVRVPVPVLSIAAIGTLALYPVPAWTLVATLTALGVGILADSWWRTDGLPRTLVGLGVITSGGVVAWPSDALMATELTVLVVASAILHWRGAATQRPWGGALLPITVAGLIWVVLDMAGVEVSQRGVPVLLVAGVLAIARARPEVELAAAGSGAIAAAVATSTSTDPSVALAVHLTVGGALASASALAHSDRRRLGWLGGGLLAAATWVRLADIGVTAPEAYTLPTALALVVIGLLRLQRDPDTSTMEALGAGLSLATVPSLLWVLAYPVSLRAVLLGAACLGLVLLGATLRWNAPLVVGSLVGTAVVLRELAPYAAEVPQWLLIGLAGTVLTALGVTWERRLRDLRAAASYVGRLR